MNVYKITLSLILSLIILSSCNDDYTIQMAENDNKEYREINFSPVEKPLLKSSHDFWHLYSHFEPGDRIGIFALEKGWQQTGITGGAFAHNRCFIFDGYNFLPMREEDRIFVRNEQLEFYAYYPYTPQMDYRNNMVLSFRVSPFQDVDFHEDYPWPNRENNLMTAQYTGELFSESIPLEFKHRLSLVAIDIYHGQDKEASGAILTRKYIRNHFDISDADRWFMIDTAKYDINMLAVQSFNGISSYVAIVPQQTVRKDTLLFRLNISGKKYEHFAEKNFLLKDGLCNYYKFTLPCMVTLKGTAGGTITGGGAYNCGEEVMVRAEPDKGYNFLGWYENGEKASNYMYYNFTANGDRLLEARFKPY